MVGAVWGALLVIAFRAATGIVYQSHRKPCIPVL